MATENATDQNNEQNQVTEPPTQTSGGNGKTIPTLIVGLALGAMGLWVYQNHISSIIDKGI